MDQELIIKFITSAIIQVILTEYKFEKSADYFKILL